MDDRTVHCESHSKIEDHVMLVSTFLGEMRASMAQRQKENDELFKIVRGLDDKISKINEQMSAMKINIGIMGAGAIFVFELIKIVINKAIGQ